jgi:bifunctional N-acetylglucosamine-1-phosphate-uridyltransferase/glucosamine-1-phosphate-acetyltransferase GlmU-like protein
MASRSVPELAVLLPGDGAGMRSRRPKLLHAILGKPVGWYAVQACRSLGCGRVALLGPAEVTAALDLEPPAPLPDSDVLLVRADCPLLTAEDLQPLLQTRAPSAVLTTLDGAAAAAILPGSALAGGPVTIEDVLHAAGLQAERVVSDQTSVGFRVDDRVGLAAATLTLRQRILEQHMRAGVTVEDLLSTYVEPDVTIGQDTVLRPMTWLSGATRIGEECEIGPSARIADSVLGDRVQVQSAVLTASTVGDDTRIGPFAQLRPGCRVGRKVKIGNFVELKNAEVEDGASLGHLAYVGDAFVGEKSNVGAGVITCNYDGKHKHKTRIGRRTFIGSHTTLIAPVEVADGAFTAAGTVVTEDVPEDGMAIGRCRQANKPEWARKWRERLQGEQG